MLMVCMGNICRSPMAEALLIHKLAEQGLSHKVHVESAGTHSYHLGQPPHDDTLRELDRHGIKAPAALSRLVTIADFTKFDFLLAMDRANLSDLNNIRHQLKEPARDSEQLRLLLEFASPELQLATGCEVPDPYYSGGFDRVFSLVDQACDGLIPHLIGDAT